jgi:hypothetical protein
MVLDLVVANINRIESGLKSFVTVFLIFYGRLQMLEIFRIWEGFTAYH